MVMGRLVGAILALALAAEPLRAEAGARVEAAESRVTDLWWGGVEVSLRLDRAVPWRVFTLDDPKRLVVDFRGLDWGEVTPEGLLQGENVPGLRFGPVRDGWSRLVLDLSRPLAVVEAGLAAEGEGARLHLRLEATDEASFVAAAGAPSGAEGAPRSDPGPALAPPADGRFVVAIDPGHGGIDPGAEREGLREAHLMLVLGQELAAAVQRAGMHPVLTREADVFVPLQERMTIARAARADVLLSLHADALEEAAASGASVYTLTREAADQASSRMVQRHEAGDLLAGLDLQGQEDELATALMDLARLDTVPRSERLAEAVAAALAEAGAAVNGRPLRQANLAVLQAADFPSVLVEAGFLSDPADRARLSSPEGRRAIVAGLVAALRDWEAAEAARARSLRR
jgi:N-acetylmuramoyl-L-alanine amidase